MVIEKVNKEIVENLKSVDPAKVILFESSFSKEIMKNGIELIWNN